MKQVIKLNVEGIEVKDLKVGKGEIAIEFEATPEEIKEIIAVGRDMVGAFKDMFQEDLETQREAWAEANVS